MYFIVVSKFFECAPGLNFSSWYSQVGMVSAVQKPLFCYDASNSSLSSNEKKVF